MSELKKDPSLYSTREDLQKPVEADFESIRKCLEDVRNQIRPMGLGVQADRVHSALLALGTLQGRIEQA